jgi:hypothetical protein
MKRPCAIFIQIFLGICLLSLVSCQKKEGKILSQNKMSMVLTDVYLTDVMLQQADKKTRSSWNHGMKDVYFQDLAYRRILDKYHITEDDFYASVDYYSRRYKVSAKIYGQVEINLNALQREVNRRDSIEKAKQEQWDFEQRWKTVEIDTAHFYTWFSLFGMDSMLLPQNDTLPLMRQHDSIPLYEYVTAYWMKVASLDSSLMPPVLDLYRTDTLYLIRWDSIMRLDSIAQIEHIAQMDSLAKSDTLPKTDSVATELPAVPDPSVAPDNKKSKPSSRRIIDERIKKERIKPKFLTPSSEFRTDDGGGR